MYGAVTLYGIRFPSNSTTKQFCNSTMISPTTPPCRNRTVWAISRSLAATEEVDVSFFSYGYLDVSVHRVSPAHLWIQCTVIQESRDQSSFDSSPGHFAAFHALHRLLAPRHPPHALSSLTTMIPASQLHVAASRHSNTAFAKYPKNKTNTK